VSVTTITATLIFDDGDPPAVRLTVQLDGAPISTRALSPAEAVGSVRVLSPETAAIWRPALAVVAGLRSQVGRNAAEQAGRLAALAEWETALARIPDLPDNEAPAAPADPPVDP
jgi:hypothetical protein